MVCPDCSPSKNIATATTHDLSAVAYHVRLRDWLPELSRAVEAAWPKRHVKYSKVAVLMLRWEESDMKGLVNETERLQSIFQDLYHFEVDNWPIPLENPDLSTSSKVNEFVTDHGKDDTLLIVHYAGHARRSKSSGSPPIWYASEAANTPTLDTSIIHPILTRAKSDSPDVLLLYDCCNPLYIRESEGDPTRAVVEGIFAGGFEAKVPGPGPDSFTTALTHELGTKEGLSVTELHRRLVRRLDNFQQTVVFESDNKVRKSNNGKAICTKDIRTAPNHALLTDNKPLRSIYLRPLETNLPKESQISEQSQARVEAQMWPKVLIAVRLSEEKGIAQELHRWLLDAPPGVVNFKGIYPSFSTLLLTEIALVVWDLLPPCAAVSFVGFITVPLGTRHPVGTGEKTTGTSQEVSKTESLEHRSGYSEKRKLFGPRTVDEQTKIALLDAIDEVLEKILTYCESIRNNTTQDFPTLILTEICRKFASQPDKYGHISEESIFQHREFLLQYLGAKELLAHDDPVLKIRDRLNPIFALYRFYDEEQEGQAESTVSTSAVSKSSLRGYVSSFWDTVSSRHPRTIDTRSTGSAAVEERESQREMSSKKPSQDSQRKVSSKKPPQDSQREVSSKKPSQDSQRKVSSKKPSQVPQSGLHRPLNLEGLDDSKMIESCIPKHVDGRRSHARPGSLRKSTYSTDAPSASYKKKSRRHSRSPDLWSDDSDSVTSVSRSRTGSTVKPLDHVGSTRSTGSPLERLEKPRSEVASPARSSGDRKGKSRVSEHVPKLPPQSEDIGWSDPVLDERYGRWYLWRLNGTGETEHSWLETAPTVATANEARSEFDEPGAKLAERKEAETSEQPHATENPYAYGSAVTSDYEIPLYERAPAHVSDNNHNGDEIIRGSPGEFEEFDPRYRVEPSWRFEPGAVFKMLWSEPLGQNRSSIHQDASDVEQDDLKQFNIGYRCFIIVATDAGHSTCVPILTYGRKGCKKKGVHPSQHGIIYAKGSKPRLLSNEPTLGYDPIAVNMPTPKETLAKESRVNYSKLVTIEHNVKVYFIGTVDGKDFPIAQHAVNDSWEKKWHQSSEKKAKGGKSTHEQASSSHGVRR